MTHLGWLIRVFLSGLFLMGFLTSPAIAGWIEVRSENFILRGDVKRKNAEKLVRDLEIFRKNVLITLGADTAKEPIPVRIYALKSKKDFKSILGSDQFAGYYMTNLRGPAFLLHSSKGLRKGSAANQIAFHEYVHHLISTKTAKNYPRWFNEGYAEYLSTFEYDKERFQIGLPNNRHAYPLRKYTWAPMDVVLGSIRSYPFKMDGKSGGNEQTIFYAQSWLAVHYILNQPEMSSKFSEYVSALPNSKNPVETFKTVFGKDSKAFEAELRAYLKRNKFSGKAIKSDPAVIALKTKELADSDGDYYLAEAAKHFSGNSRDQSRTKSLLSEISSENRFWAEALASQAYIAALNDDFDKADHKIKEAIAAAPSNGDVLQIAGEILVMKYGNERRDSDMQKANDYFSQLLKISPDNPSVNYYYAVTCGQISCDSMAELSAADMALSYFRNANYAGSNMNLASVYMKNGRYAQAQAIADFAKAWGTDPQTRMSAQMLSRSISQRQ